MSGYRHFFREEMKHLPSGGLNRVLIIAQKWRESSPSQKQQWLRESPQLKTNKRQLSVSDETKSDSRPMSKRPKLISQMDTSDPETDTQIMAPSPITNP